MQGPRRTTITCPDGDTASIKLAAYGGGLTNQDVTDTMAQGCSESSCLIDMDQLPDPEGKTLRVEYACACGAGKKMQRDAGTRQCELCPAGQARMRAQPDCQVCPEGTYQDEPGQVSWRVTFPLHVPFVHPTGRQLLRMNVMQETQSSNLSSCAGCVAARGCGQVAAHPAVWHTYMHVCTMDSKGCKSTACICLYLDDSPAVVQSMCKLCPAGHWSPRGVSSCTPCAAGTFTSETNSTTCTPAPKNTFTNTTGATAATVRAMLSSNTNQIMCSGVPGVWSWCTAWFCTFAEEAPLQWLPCESSGLA
jgi:hypothetical protein